MNSSDSSRPTILTFVAYYLPAYKCGGPVRSIANLVDHLGDEFDFRIITSDRDSFETAPFQGITADVWIRMGKALVYYTSPGNRTVAHFSKLLRETNYNTIYFNSFFSPVFTLYPLLALRTNPRISCKPIVVAPRGEFSEGALALSFTKKLIYCYLAQITRLYKDVTWQASSKYEEADIRKQFGKSVPVVVAPNLSPVLNSADVLPPKSVKTAGYLKIVFLSRISRKKNLDVAIKMISKLKGKIQFNIFGQVGDESYWAECRKLIRCMPENIIVRYCGSVPHNQVCAVMRQHDLFFLPTRGENFGHVILEALCAGCPVLISDKTPWRNLKSKNVGWDISLDQKEMFRKCLQMCVDVNNDKYLEWTESARKFGLQIIEDDKVVEKNRRLFRMIGSMDGVGY